MPGPPPQPTALRKLKGNRNPQRINKDEPALPQDPPIMPADFEGIPQAKEMWEFTVGQLQKMGTLSSANTSALEVLCRAWARYHQANEAIDKYGMVLVSRTMSGTVEVKRNPFSVELHKHTDTVIKLLQEFGLTLSSMTRVKALNPDGAPDPLIEMLKARAGNN